MDKPKYKIGDKFIHHYGNNSHIIYKILCVSSYKSYTDKQFQYFVESIYDDGGEGRDHRCDCLKEEIIDWFVKYNGKYAM